VPNNFLESFPESRTNLYISDGIAFSILLIFSFFKETFLPCRIVYHFISLANPAVALCISAVLWLQLAASVHLITRD